MKVYLNNKEFDIEPFTNLFDFLEQLNLHTISNSAVAINNTVIIRRCWNDTILNDNDKIILINAICGG